MAKAIYSLWMGKFTEAWYQLTEEEQENLLAQVGPEKAGGKNLLVCDSSWSSEHAQFFGVHEFPNIEAVQRHSENLDRKNWRRYVDAVTVLGTEFPQS